MKETYGQRLLSNLHQRRLRHQKRSHFYRAVFALAALGVILGGVVLLVLPGPAILLFIIGLSMLALEFDWAERWLGSVVRYADEAASQSKRLSTTQRVAVLATFGLLTALVILAFVYFDIPYLPG